MVLTLPKKAESALVVLVVEPGGEPVLQFAPVDHKPSPPPLVQVAEVCARAVELGSKASTARTISKGRVGILIVVACNVGTFPRKDAAQRVGLLVVAFIHVPQSCYHNGGWAERLFS